MKTWQLWREDKAAVARQLEEGRELDGHNSAFGDNDLIAAQVTNLLRADLLILLSVVDGLLDADGKTISVVQDVEDASGHVDEMAYDLGVVDQTLPFLELRRHSRVNDRSKTAGRDRKFSEIIRHGLPGFE